MTPRKILCPIDFSAGARYAQRVATRIANESGAPLVLVHAWYVPPIPIVGELVLPGDSIQALVDDAQRGLTDAITDAKRAGVETVTSELVAGPPAERILEQATPRDLIVMGTHGRTGLSRFLLGSVAERVVRSARCSVLVTRDIGEPQPYRHLLVPVDFSESSRRAVDEAGDIASRSDATVTLLHVLELPTASFIQDADERATAMLDDWAELVEQKTRTRVTRIVKTGAPAQQVLGVAIDDPSIDLIVLGSHGRMGLSRLLLGSVAEKVVRHASRPVLIAR
ncbi:MAG: universal stress protein [Deltaproteobacteria bacterium]|nr:universal stress protein [Deltaproteobacteria bacterium]